MSVFSIRCSRRALRSCSHQQLRSLYPSYRYSTMESSKTSVPTLKLNDGNQIPVVGFGLGTLAKPSEEQFIGFIKSAIDAGIRHVDGAQRYKSEDKQGLAIRETGVPREDMYVVTKYDRDMKSVKESFNASLEKLGFDYVDLYLIHFPFPAENDQELQRQWAEMEDIKASGRAKSIGVSNFLVDHLEAILKTAKVKPAINSVEYHPYLQTEGLMDYHKKHGIAMSWYGALAPLTKAPDSAVTKLWKEIASKYGVSEAEIGLRWCLDQGCVAITTSSNPDRTKLFGGRLHSFSLTEKEISDVAEAGKNNYLRVYLKSDFAPWDAGVTKPAP